MTNVDNLFQRPDGMSHWDPDMRVTKDEFLHVKKGMEQAENSHLFDEMFQGTSRKPEGSMSRKKLLQSINPQMKLTRNFFMQIYGYDITEPGFAEEALQALERAGSTRSRGYYNTFVSEYEAEQAESLKPVAAECVTKLNKEFERKVGEEQRIQERILKILQNG